MIEKIETLKISCSHKFSSGKSAFENIADLQNQICNADRNNLDIYLIEAIRYGKTFVFLLGCLIALGMQYGKIIRLYLPDKQMKHFQKMGILDYYKQQRKTSNDFFRIDKTNNAMRLINKNIDKIPVNMTEKSQEILLSLIAEVYNNAIEHSEAKYVMGGCYKKQGLKRFYFSCYDTGIGIIGSVKDSFHIHENNFSFNKAILKWALKKGNSTKPPPRGIGLDWLLDFSKLNHGTIKICSSDVLFIQTPQGEHIFYQLTNHFQGTFFEMEIVEDPNAIYKLYGE